MAASNNGPARGKEQAFIRLPGRFKWELPYHDWGEISRLEALWTTKKPPGKVSTRLREELCSFRRHRRASFEHAAGQPRQPARMVRTKTVDAAREELLASAVRIHDP